MNILDIQLIYPQISLFVGLYDARQFQPPTFWRMPIDPNTTPYHEFHVDYHHLPNPNLDDPHTRGDIVIEALYLLNASTTIADRFPYGRHHAVLLGVKLAGIPNVSMVAFYRWSGVHEVIYWGGWENESYYLPERGWTINEESFNKSSAEQRGDCIDAARRINRKLTREGLRTDRTDHTYRHHGERSYGYQMVLQQVWSPYNLVGLYSPHIGQLLKPGAILLYYQSPEDTLFWGWDLDLGGLKAGLDAVTLQAYIDGLGVAGYMDQTKETE